MDKRRKRLMNGLITAGLALGGVFAIASPAAAGTSIPATYNAGTGMSYAYYASTDQFCIDPSSNVTYGIVDFAGSSNPLGPISPREGWACQSLKDIGFHEGDQVTFTLRSTTDRTGPYDFARSVGKLTV